MYRCIKVLYDRGNNIMSRESISENIKRRLYAESMGRCMNPECQKELFVGDGDIAEKAHIVPYCEGADNSYENLLILCPNCHTEFDKISKFNPEQVKGWKQTRKEELEKVFCRKFASFKELENVVAPLLYENKSIFENYYLNDEKKLWDKFEGKILINNKKLKLLLETNLDLIQRHREKDYSNLSYVYSFMAHVDEFEATRTDDEKNRKVLFPEELNSMFGVEPVNKSLLPSTESLECLIMKLIEQEKFEDVVLDDDNPYIKMKLGEKTETVFLQDTPRLRQIYYEYGCFRSLKVRLDSLIFALKYIKSRNINYKFINQDNLREVMIKGKKMIFVYEYCLSEAALQQLLPEEKSIIVNLHNWNGESCISQQAYEVAKEMNVVLFTMKGFYRYINEIRRK